MTSTEPSWLDRGRQHLQRGNAAAALECFAQAVAADTQSAEAWNAYGVALRQLNRIQEALRANEQALRLDPALPKAWYNKGLLLELNLNQPDAALKCYERALQLQPGFQEARTRYQQLARPLTIIAQSLATSAYPFSLYISAPSPPSSDASSTRATGHEVADAQVWLEKGNQQFMAGDFQGAIACYDQALKLKPDYHEAFFGKGSALFALGRHEEAIACYDQALKLKPDYHEAFLGKGSALFALGRKEEAIACYDQALKLKPDDHRAFFGKGCALSDLGRKEEAIACYDQALKIKPDLHEAFNNKGLALSALGRKEEAIACYDQALKIKPDLHEVFYNKGNALSALGRKEEAIACYDQALKLKPDYHDAFHNKGAALSALGRYEEAIACYDQALKLKPDDHEAFFGKGTALDDLGRYEEAIACYDQALKIKPDKHKAFCNKGTALSALGRKEEAIACYDQALKIKPDLHEVWINRGVAAVSSPGVKTLVCWFLPVEMQNPALDQRGYPGQLACLTEGLKYVQRGANPEGWGRLHLATGRAHYFHGCFRPDARCYFQQALQEYRMALEVLTPERFPERHLEVIQDGIRALLGLGETAAARQWRMQGLTVLQDLYRTASSSQKRQYEGKFASFRQLTVDLLVQEGEYATALREAELDKNRCLDWMLTAWTAAWEEPSWSPTVADMRQLLDASTAVVYWHLSPDALTTFVLRADASEPRVLHNDSAEQPDSSARRQLRDFEDWVIDWNRDYDDYRAKGNDAADSSERAQHPWRTQLAQRLARLRTILRIADIEAHLEGVSRLILVPHRDLHRFPLHGLFNDRFTVTYLPSVQVGLSLPASPDAAAPITSGDALLSIEVPASEGLEELKVAEVESLAIRSAFPPATCLAQGNATLAAVIQALQTPHRLIHFTGHGEYNQRQPHRSALALAGSDRLTAETIQSLSLEHCDLVSLSSCETAVTGSQTIETEYVGLVSAFLRAKAAHVVSTLWVVDEISSAYLMIHFYHQLLTQPGISLAIALQKTQQWLRQVTYPELAQWLHQLSNTWNTPVLRRLAMAIETDPAKISTTQPPYANLYFWAAFTLSGKF